MERFGRLITEVVRQRAEHVEERVQRLVDAGVSMDQLFLLSDSSCECSGTGIVIECRGKNLRAHECPRCLGVGMIEVTSDVGYAAIAERIGLSRERQRQRRPPDSVSG